MVCLVPLMLLTLLGCAPDGPEVTILDAGIYELQLVGTIVEPDTALGQWTRVQDERLVKATADIPAELGLEFGYRYTVTGLDKGTLLNLEFILRHPPMTLPQTLTPFTEQIHKKTTRCGEPQYDGFGFEHEWERVPGEWVFEIRHRGKTLSRQSFLVHKR